MTEQQNIEHKMDELKRGVEHINRWSSIGAWSAFICACAIIGFTISGMVQIRCGKAPEGSKTFDRYCSVLIRDFK